METGGGAIPVGDIPAMAAIPEEGVLPIRVAVAVMLNRLGAMWCPQLDRRTADWLRKEHSFRLLRPERVRRPSHRRPAGLRIRHST